MSNISKGDYAKELFMKGYNCSQSVVCAFAEEIGLDIDTAAKMVSGFGGGFGRMREVCGAVSGMVFVASMLYGYSEPGNNQVKLELYKVVQQLMREYEQINGSYICAKLLGTADKSPVPEARTPEYYKKRPCPDLVKCAADILERYIALSAERITK